jgi:dTDP-4-amino-4,6-dideoxygalactose transaminase
MNQEPGTANVSPYEIALGERLGRDVRAFAFWKGRAALEAILRALGVSAGDEVIVPGFTFTCLSSNLTLGPKPRGSL